jgi:rod shape-determining protein MreC
MKSLFERGPSLRIRFFIALGCATLLLFLDHRLNTMQPVRSFLNTVVAPIQYLAVLPQQISDRVDYILTTRSELRLHNERLGNQLLELEMAVQRLNFIESENDRLRQLLGSDVRGATRRMVTEVVAVASDPFSHQVVINKGSSNGAYVGQPVLDNRGIVGQLVSVGLNTARVLLISDQSHAISLWVQRNDIRVLAQGTGDLQKLALLYISHSSDIQVGDVLLSSGLDEVFPEGYPVAEVIEIDRNEQFQYAQVAVRPYAQLDRVRSLLLLWPGHVDEQPVFGLANDDVTPRSEFNYVD